MFRHILLIIFILALTHFATVHAQEDRGKTVIIDSRHYSDVFGEIRNFRVFLPPAYRTDSAKRFPVIYFMHGWSQRYFGDGPDAYASFDQGNDNKGDNIANYVATHDVIVVKSDGYNRSIHEGYYVRPYNVSPVETHRQFPVYFPELISHIDRNFRTLADREHRGISGLSMGGFMTYWIAAKYPHLFSAAGSFCGSPEFIVGPKDFPTEYRHIEMYKNFASTNVRLNYGDKDFIRGYHEDMNRVWPQLMDNYEYKIYDAEHSTAGMAEMFDFIMKTFSNPANKPAQWSHTDVYPAFSVWDYEVSTDRNTPGFTSLENVGERGFRTSVRTHMPDGELLHKVNVTITTAPVYQKNTTYQVTDIEIQSGNIRSYTSTSDNNGRLLIKVNGGEHEIGINGKGKGAAIGIASVQIDKGGWITNNKEATIKLTLFNKGSSAARNIRATLSAFRKNVHITKSSVTVPTIPAASIQSSPITFEFTARDTSDVLKLILAISDEDKNTWNYPVVLPLREDVKQFPDVAIADGKIINIVTGAKDTQSVFLGNGNGDGIANPGESIVVLVKDSNKYWRTNLLLNDPYLNPSGINQRKSDDWTYFDYVGGSAKYNVPLIAGDCPEGRRVVMFAEYWTPKHPLHIIHRGTVELKITGTDQTSPLLEDIFMQADNTAEVKVLDGSPSKQVSAKFILQSDTTRTFSVPLTDDGKNGDRAAKDHVFSRQLTRQQFGIYRVVVQATDSKGNTIVKEMEKKVVVR